MTSKRQDIILSCLKQQGHSSRENLEQHLRLLGQSVSKVTLLRDLDKLVSAAIVEKSGTGRATKYTLSFHTAQNLPIDVADYFSLDADERKLRSEKFNFSIFQELNHLLTEDELKELDSLNDIFRQKKEKLSTRLLQKEFERLTVELAWKSSKIEGNTYTLLDTERLLKENISAVGKTAEETQMVINHKKVLDYILEQPEYYKEITVAKIEEIHTLLTVGLSVKKGIRSGMVGIVGTNYRPLDNKFQFRETLEQLTILYNETKNTIERALPPSS